MTDNLDQKGARRVPTYSATRFLVENEGSATVRLTFGEEWEGEVTYHQAQRLSFADAIELHKVLGAVISAKPAGSVS